MKTTHFGICPLAFIACRKEPSHKSEMVSQLLFGEHFTILNKKENWLHIKTNFDNYECWVEGNGIEQIPQEEFDAINNSEKCYSAALLSKAIHLKSKTTFNLVLGSHLPFFDENKFRIDKDDYELTGTTSVIEYPNTTAIASGATAIAPQPYNRVVLLMKEIIGAYKNAPYLWGGKTPFGIDCSGFTQMVFKLCNITLPRDSHQQAKLGKPVTEPEKCITGDLAFFANSEMHESGEEKKITHVGILLVEEKKSAVRDSKSRHAESQPDAPQFSCKIAHASGFVRTDKFDRQGIYNSKLRKYTHTLVEVRRLISLDV